MKLKLPILLSLSLVFLAGIALTVNWGDPSYDADEMINSEEEIVHSSPEITPWESREQQKNKSSLDWTMPSTLTGTGESPGQARSLSESSNETENTISAQETESSQNATSDLQQPSSQSGNANVQGNWFFTLNDTITRDLAVSLFQNGEDVYGTGKIKEGNSSIDIAVSGTISGSKMAAKLISTNPIIQYKLNLTLDRDWAAGKYLATPASGDSWIGTVEGQKIS